MTSESVGHTFSMSSTCIQCLTKGQSTDENKASPEESGNISNQFCPHGDHGDSFVMVESHSHSQCERMGEHTSSSVSLQGRLKHHRLSLDSNVIQNKPLLPYKTTSCKNRSLSSPSIEQLSVGHCEQMKYTYDSNFDRGIAADHGHLRQDRITSCLSNRGYLSAYDHTRWTGISSTPSRNHYIEKHIMQHRDLSPVAWDTSTSKKTFSHSSTESSLVSMSSPPPPPPSSSSSFSYPPLSLSSTSSAYSKINYQSAIDTKSANKAACPSSVEPSFSGCNDSADRSVFVDAQDDKIETGLSKGRVLQYRESESSKTQERIWNYGGRYWAGYVDTDDRLLGHQVLSPRGSNGSICSNRSSNADSAVDLLTPEEEGLDSSNIANEESVDWFKTPDRMQYNIPQKGKQDELVSNKWQRNIKLPSVIISDYSGPVSELDKETNLEEAQNHSSRGSTTDFLTYTRQNSSTSLSSNESFASVASDGLSDLEDTQLTPTPKPKIGVIKSVTNTWPSGGISINNCASTPSFRPLAATVVKYLK